MSASAIHHVTAISGPANKNLKFYKNVLGLRLVKKTVNFDDPGTYHLYYGDEVGTPGSILTFFPWDHVAPGRLGAGETSRTSFRVPLNSIDWWKDRLGRASVSHEAPVTRFGETILAFKDPDGMRLALVGVESAGDETGWSEAQVPAEHAIRGFHGVTLLVRKASSTAAILTNVFGQKEVGREGSIVRFEAPGAVFGRFVELDEVPDAAGGRPGGGSVHHIAFRAANDAAEQEMARKLVTEHGLQVTEQKDRNYFRSIYFREPNGVLFEIATDEPGFAVDESVETLGDALKLPPFLEGMRQRIEEKLPPLG